MNDLEQITYRRLALLLIAIGLVLAAGSLLELSAVYKLWPVLLLLPGIGFIGIFLKRKARGAPYLAVGEYLILFSGLALYCNFTSWGNLACLWPAFVAFLGVVFFTLFLFHRNRRILLFFGLLFLSLSASFFLVFLIDVRYWWSIFILLGLSIILSGKFK